MTKRYQVTWGADSAIVWAADPDDAWARFSDGNELAKRAPKLRERKILEVADAPQPVLLIESSDEEVDADDLGALGGSP